MSRKLLKNAFQILILFGLLLAGFNLQPVLPVYARDGGDAYEPNDTPENATLIQVGDFFTPSISPVGDVDWFKFSITESQRMKIGISWGMDTDPIVTLYDSSMNALPLYHMEIYWESQFTPRLIPGDYYIKVEGNGELPYYEISINATPYGGDFYEQDDNTFETAALIQLSTIDQDRALAPLADQDWWKFEVTGQAGVVIESSAVDGGVELTLFDSSQNVIETNNESGVNLDSGIDRQCGVDALPAGTYYIRAETPQNAGEVSYYRFHYQTNSCSDSYEPNEPYYNANPIAMGETQTQSILPATDEDWLSFALSAPACVLIQSTNANVALELYESNSISPGLLTSSDTARIDYSLPASSPGSPYYIKITSKDGSEIPQYDITLQNNGLCVNDFEPDNNATQAIPLINDQSLYRSISPADDVDWTMFTLSTDTELTIDAGSAAVMLSLFDGDLNLLESSSSIDRICGTDPLPAGQYFVKAESDGNSNEVINYLPDLHIVRACADLYEPNNLPEQATLIQNGETQNHSMVPDKDVDWLTFTLEVEGGVSVGYSASIPAGEDFSQYQLVLYNSTLAPVESTPYPSNGRTTIERKCGVNPLSAGTYYLRLINHDNSEIPSYSISLMTNEGCQVAPDVPLNIHAGDSLCTNPNAVDVNWAAVTGATYYEIYRLTPNQGMTLLGSSETASYADATAEPGISNTYSVKACNSFGCSAFSSPDTGMRAIPAPANFQAADGLLTDKIDLSWESVASVSLYRIYRNNLPIQDVQTNTFADLTSDPGQTISYSVQACLDQNTCGCFATDTGWRKLTAPLQIQASDGTFSEKVSLSWLAVSGAETYEVYRSETQSGEKVLLTSLSSTTYDDTGASAGKNYLYWVKACTSLGCSDFSLSDTGFRNPLSAPTGVQASDGKYYWMISIQWKAVPGAHYYKIYRSKTLTGNQTLVGYSVYPLTQDFIFARGASYYYWVQACKGDICSPLSTPDVGKTR